MNRSDPGSNSLPKQSDHSADQPANLHVATSLESTKVGLPTPHAQEVGIGQVSAEAHATADHELADANVIASPEGRPPSRPHFPSIRIPVKVHTFDSFRYRNYRLLWFTTFFSSAGFWLQQIIIGWLTYDLTQSAFLTTVAMGLDALPVLLLGPLGGVLVDSWDRRKLLIFIYAYQGVITAIFGFVVIMGWLETWHIFAFILMMGLAWVISDPTRMSLIPNTVPKENLVNGFALNSMAFSVTRMAAPAIGGVLLAVSGPGPAILFQALLQATAVVVAWYLVLPRSGDRTKLRVKSAFSNLVEGARYVTTQPVIMGVMLLGVLPPLLAFPFVNGLMPVFAAEVFDTGSVGLGLLMSSVGAGSVVGTLALASFGNVRYKGKLMIGAIAVTSIGMLGFSQVTSMGLAFPVLMLLSVGMMTFFATSSATVQSIVPDKFRGRVSSIYTMAFGTLPLGSLLAGALASRLGAPTATLIAAILVAVVLGAFVLRSRTVWRYE